MLSEQDKAVLSRLDPFEVLDFFGPSVILSFIDPLHGISIWGWERVFAALEAYENHRP